MSEIIMIAAVSKNNVIGKNNSIPWHIKEDLQRFRELTLNFPVIMGRKTFESLPIKPLPHRTNIVLSKQENLELQGVIVKQSLEEAIEYCRGFEKVFIIGGQNVFEQGMRYAVTLEITRVEKEVEGDAFFPEIKEKEWKLEKEEEKLGYCFQTYKKITYS